MTRLNIIILICNAFECDALSQVEFAAQATTLKRPLPGVPRMSDHRTYKKIELVGSSKLSIEDAIGNALAECAKSVRHMDWFEVVETRGHIVDGKVGHYQVTLKVGFRLADS